MNITYVKQIKRHFMPSLPLFSLIWNKSMKGISQSLCCLWEPWGDGVTKCIIRPGPGPIHFTWRKPFQLSTCSNGLRKGELEGSPS